MGLQRLGHEGATELKDNNKKAKLKHFYLFSLPYPSRDWKLLGSQQLYQINEEGYLLNSYRNLKVFWDP